MLTFDRKSASVLGQLIGVVWCHIRCSRKTVLVAGLLASCAGDCLAPDFKVPSFPQFFKGRQSELLQEVGRAPTGPGGMCQLPNGDYVISCHQFFGHQHRVMRQTRKGWEPFPNLEMNVPGSGAPIELDSVLGLANDGPVVWMLDNGRRGGHEPKLVAWDTRSDRLHRIILLNNAVTRSSILKNLVLDPDQPFVYVSDPADGVDSALIVVDLRTGLARRVLQGHVSVRNDPSINIILDGKPLEARRADGRVALPLSGVSPFAVDRKGEWLYFGPRNGTTLYRVRTEKLRDPGQTPEMLNGGVEGFSPKPVCDSIVIDSKDRIYFSDIGNSAVSYVTPEDSYTTVQPLVKDPRMVWPGGLTLGTDGQLHFFCNQLNRAPIFNGGKNQTSSPYYLFKIKPLSSRKKLSFPEVPDLSRPFNDRLKP